MRNRIRGATLILIAFMIVLFLTGCSTAKQSRNQQTFLSNGTQKSENTTALTGQQSEEQAQKTEELWQDRKSTGLIQEAIPSQEATVNIPIQNLLDLPEGAGYTSRNGRASVNLHKDGDNIVVTGHCDSLARLCLFCEQEVFRRRSEADSLRETISRMEALQTEKETVDHTEQNLSESVKEKPPATWYKWLLAGFITGILAGSPLKRIANKVFTPLKRLYGKE